MIYIHNSQDKDLGEKTFMDCSAITYPKVAEKLYASTVVTKPSDS